MTPRSSASVPECSSAASARTHAAKLPTGQRRWNCCVSNSVTWGRALRSDSLQIASQFTARARAATMVASGTGGGAGTAGAETRFCMM
jgi:hypothetical protein